MWVRNNKGNVFVGNLPPDFADERLAETFDPYGIVLSASVARDPQTGARLRYGFVDIATENAATQAIDALNGIEIDGCKLNVKASQRNSGKGAANPARKPGAPARRPLQAMPPRRTPVGGNEGPVRRPPIHAAERPKHTGLDGPERLERPDRIERPQRPAQSSIIAAELADMEPPPRREFEVVHKPARRRSTPSFQVERRSLPRRS